MTGHWAQNWHATVEKSNGKRSSVGGRRSRVGGINRTNQSSEEKQQWPFGSRKTPVWKEDRNVLDGEVLSVPCLATNTNDARYSSWDEDEEETQLGVTFIIYKVLLLLLLLVSNTIAPLDETAEIFIVRYWLTRVLQESSGMGKEKCHVACTTGLSERLRILVQLSDRHVETSDCHLSGHSGVCCTSSEQGGMKSGPKNNFINKTSNITFVCKE